MDKLKSFLSDFKVTKVYSLEEMLMLPEGKKASPNSLFKYSLSYEYNSDEPNSLQKGEDEIISDLKDKINKLGFPTSLVGINILHDFAYNADQAFVKGFGGRLLWTAYVYPMYSPRILNNKDYYTKRLQELAYCSLSKGLDHGKLFVDPFSLIDRQIGKTNMIINHASEIADSIPGSSVVVVCPSFSMAREYCKTKYPNLSSRVEVIPQSDITVFPTGYFERGVPSCRNRLYVFVDELSEASAKKLNQDIFSTCQRLGKDSIFTGVSGYAYINPDDLIKKLNSSYLVKQ